MSEKVENMSENRKKMFKDKIGKQGYIEEITDIKSRKYQCFYLGISYSQFWKHYLAWDEFDNLHRCENCGHKLESQDEISRGWCDICNLPEEAGE